MAITTENRRRSTIAVLPLSDGAIEVLDRKHSTWNYAGIASTDATDNGPWYPRPTATSTWRGVAVTAGSWTRPGASAGAWVKPNEVDE